MERDGSKVKHGGLRASLVTALVLVVVFNLASARASSRHDGNISLMNPLNPAGMAVEMAVDRSLAASLRPRHAGFIDRFSQPTVFAEYGFGTNKDKRANGFDNDVDSLSVGGDTLFAGSTFLGAMVNYTQADGKNSGGATDKIKTLTPTVYVSRAINDWLYWGGSLSLSSADSKVQTTTTDSDGIVVAPYLMALKQMKQWTFSVTPTYVLGAQDVDYGGGASDSSLVGRLLLMGRAAYTINNQWNVAGSVNVNQVLHKHLLDSETDNDSLWFTLGAKVNYQINERIGAYAGLSRDVDSKFSNNFAHVGAMYAF